MGEVRENRILAGTSEGEIFCGMPVADWRRLRKRILQEQSVALGTVQLKQNRDQCSAFGT
jgi:hypothetical protein